MWPLQSVRHHPPASDPAHRALSLLVVNLETGHWPHAWPSLETSVPFPSGQLPVSLRKEWPSESLAWPQKGQRESLQKPRWWKSLLFLPGQVTQRKKGLARKPGAGQAQPAAGSCPWSSRGHSVSQTLVCSGRSACLSQGREGLGGDISLVLGLSKEASRGGPRRTGDTRQQWRSIQGKQENTWKRGRLNMSTLGGHRKGD